MQESLAHRCRLPQTAGGPAEASFIAREMLVNAPVPRMTAGQNPEHDTAPQRARLKRHISRRPSTGPYGPAKAALNLTAIGHKGHKSSRILRSAVSYRRISPTQTVHVRPNRLLTGPARQAFLQCGLHVQGRRSRCCSLNRCSAADTRPQAAHRIAGECLVEDRRIHHQFPTPWWSTNGSSSSLWGCAVRVGASRA